MMWPCSSACLTNECIVQNRECVERMGTAGIGCGQACQLLHPSPTLLPVQALHMPRSAGVPGAGMLARTWSHTSVRNIAIALGILLQSVHSAQAGSAASVSTAAELKAAIDSDIAHVEITQHLDLRLLPVFIDDLHAASDPLYTLRALFVNVTALESISVRIIS